MIQMCTFPFIRGVPGFSWMPRLLLLLAAFSLASCTVIPELGALADKGGPKGRKILVSL